ncbi:MAG: riboflavin synthase [Rickettsiales bacterium]
MFTGIISDVGNIVKAEQNGDLRLEIACGFLVESIKLGDSIACNGACLTVVEVLTGGFAVELSAETVERTACGQWQAGKQVNLERSLRVGDSLDGHIVSGHVDGVAVIEEIEKFGDSHIVTISAPHDLMRFIAEKGSVTLDGISLTVNYVDGNMFKVNIIPHTWQNTTLCYKEEGGELNMEIDMLARYVARLLEK